MKRFKSSFISIILAVLVLVVPVQSFAALSIGDNFNAIGDTIQSSVLGKEPVANKTPREKVRILVTPYTASLFFDESYMNYSIKEYNLLLNKWEDVAFTNYFTYLKINALSPNSYHKIKIYAGKKSIGTYTFYTKPENVSEVNTEISKKEIVLSWNNEKNYDTQIYKKSKKIDIDTDEVTEESKWEKLDTVNTSEYKDADIKEDTYYYYKIRYVTDNLDKKLYSDFKYFDEIYIPLEINNILETGGYIYISQLDKLNRTIPYPYKDNGKTLGTSGCGVCSSLMIIRNMTKFEPTLETYTETLIEKGARAPYGSNIYVIADYLKDEYKLNHTYTKDIDKLKKHLKDGNMAIAHVGKKRYFARAGHFVAVVGIVKDEEQNERAVILDPTFTKTKYTSEERKEMGIEFSDDGIVTAPFETLFEDCKDEYFTLFTAEKSVKK